MFSYIWSYFWFGKLRDLLPVWLLHRCLKPLSGLNWWVPFTNGNAFLRECWMERWWTIIYFWSYWVGLFCCRAFYLCLDIPAWLSVLTFCCDAPESVCLSSSVNRKLTFKSVCLHIVFKTTQPSWEKVKLNISYSFFFWLLLLKDKFNIIHLFFV